VKRDPLNVRLERAGRILQNNRETSAAEDCYTAADILRRAERQIVKLLAYVQKLEAKRGFEA
jgi:hypothetical protein